VYWRLNAHLSGLHADPFAIYIQRMKRTVLILILTIIIAAGIIFTGYRSSAQKQKTAQMNMIYASRAVNKGQKPAEVEEWIKFRYESGLKIGDLENQIAELKINIKDNEEIFDALYIKKVAVLTEKIKFIKTRLENYENSPGNWESFSNEINHDMATLVKALSELNVEKK
jgi:hypothetical protein